MLRIVYKRKFYYAFSLTLFILAILALSFWGLKSGVDFTGGSLLQVNFEGMARPQNDKIKNALNGLNLDEIITQPTGETGVILKFKEVDEAKHQEILKKLQDTFAPGKAVTATPAPVQVQGAGAAMVTAVQTEVVSGPRVSEANFQSIGPSVSSDLKTKTFYAITIVLIAIICYIAFAFRKVGRPVASWKYGVIAVIALAHDVTITIGVFAVLGHFLGVEIDTSFVAAVLTVLGFSVHDTIVIFDRVRENLRRYQGDFEETVNKSLNETIVRSINTTLVTLLSLLAIFLFGGETIKYFALALIVGIAAGAYSSIFLAAPGLVTWHGWDRRSGR
ncbi:MAG: protein translocase subunit SecF [Patescibacteria group bacterium]|jgi:preprotein translocase subunit SecF